MPSVDRPVVPLYKNNIIPIIIITHTLELIVMCIWFWRLLLYMCYVSVYMYIQQLLRTDLKVHLSKAEALLTHVKPMLAVHQAVIKARKHPKAEVGTGGLLEGEAAQVSDRCMLDHHRIAWLHSTVDFLFI